MVAPIQPIFAQPAAATYVRAAVPTQAAVGAATAGYAVTAGQVQAKPADNHALESAAIKVTQVGTLLMPVVFMGDIATRALGFLGGKGIGLVSPTAGNRFKSWLRAPYEALHHTNLNDLGSFGSNFNAIKTAIAKDGKLADDFASTLVSNTTRSEAINAGFSRITAPVGKPVAGALDALDNTGVMKTVTTKITDFAAKREATLLGKGKEATRWTNLKGFGGFGSMLKNLPSKLGNAKLFGVAAVAGAVMVAGSVLLNNRRADREDNNALKEFAADVYGVNEGQLTKAQISGEKAHPLVAEANKIYDKNVTGRRIMDAFSIAGTVATGGNFLSASPSVAVMAADMGIPTIGEFFSHENPTLGIYSALKKAEAGEFTLAPEQKTQAVAQLLTTVPAIAKNTGMQNAYVMPVADAMVQKGMSTSQIVQTIANPMAFQKLSQEVIGKVNQERQALAEQAKQEAAAPAAQAPTMLAAAAPGKQVHAIEHHGTQAHAQHLGRH